jgi:hypothetical protein
MLGQGGPVGGLGAVVSGRSGSSPVGEGRSAAGEAAGSDDCTGAAGSGDVGIAGRARDGAVACSVAEAVGGGS